MPATHATGLYIFSLQRQESADLGKVFLTLYNPLTSGTVMSIGGVFTSCMSVKACPPYPLRGYRIVVEPTGGTLHTTAEIAAADTKVFNPTMVVRSNAPTVSAFGAAVFNSPPATVANTVQSTQQTDLPPGFNPFLIRPGEGIALKQDIGSDGVFWNLSIVWRQLRG